MIEPKSKWNRKSESKKLNQSENVLCYISFVYTRNLIYKVIEPGHKMYELNNTQTLECLLYNTCEVVLRRQQINHFSLYILFNFCMLFFSSKL